MLRKQGSFQLNSKNLPDHLLPFTSNLDLKCLLCCLQYDDDVAGSGLRYLKITYESGSPLTEHVTDASTLRIGIMGVTIVQGHHHGRNETDTIVLKKDYTATVNNRIQRRLHMVRQVLLINKITNSNKFIDI